MGKNITFIAQTWEETSVTNLFHIFHKKSLKINFASFEKMNLNCKFKHFSKPPHN